MKLKYGLIIIIYIIKNDFCWKINNKSKDMYLCFTKKNSFIRLLKKYLKSMVLIIPWKETSMVKAYSTQILTAAELTIPSVVFSYFERNSETESTIKKS